LQVAGLLAFALIGVLLWKALTEKTIAIAPISVPKMLAESGYTADVAAQRLHDALNKVVKDAHTRKEGPNVALQADLPSIVVPTIGLSLETIAADIRTFFHIARRSNISGELTIAQKQLWLRLRINGQDFFTSPNGVDPERPNDLLAAAAEKVYELADPYIAAASLSQGDPGKCLEIARRIIAHRPETDQSVPWAHNLVGLVLSAQHNTDEAIAEYRKAIELDPRFANPHGTLGDILRGQHKTEEAIAEYRKAIELDPRDATAHGLLGVALSDQSKTEEAIAEYNAAIRLDPKNAYPVLWLYLARARSGPKIAAAELETNGKKLKQPGWPYPVVELYLGRRMPEATLAAATKPDDRCEAQFYIGEWRLLRGNRPAAIVALKAAAETCPKTFVEYKFARAELHRLGR
jgi:lipoprotein NlpI